MLKVSGLSTDTDAANASIEVSILKIDRLANDIPEITVWNSYLIYSLAAVGLLALLALFLFKNRKLQLLLCGFNYLLMVGSGFFMYFYIQQGFEAAGQAGTSEMHYLFLLSVLFPVWNFLAMKGILSDEKLIRSMDRLR